MKLYILFNTGARNTCSPYCCFYERMIGECVIKITANENDASIFPSMRAAEMEKSLYSPHLRNFIVKESSVKKSSIKQVMGLCKIDTSIQMSCFVFPL